MNKKDYELIAKCLGQTIKFYAENNIPGKHHNELVGNFYDRIVASLAKNNPNFNARVFLMNVKAEANK